MSFSDRIADPEGERSSEIDEQDVMRKKFKISETSSEHNPNSDLVAMSTMERILACGVNHWYARRERYSSLLSFDFANKEQGLIPVKMTELSGKTLIGTFNSITNEIEGLYPGQSIFIWSDER